MSILQLLSQWILGNDVPRILIGKIFFLQNNALLTPWCFMYNKVLLD
jgi:hypothetical protein